MNRPRLTNFTNFESRPMQKFTIDFHSRYQRSSSSTLQKYVNAREFDVNLFMFPRNHRILFFPHISKGICKRIFHWNFLSIFTSEVILTIFTHEQIFCYELIHGSIVNKIKILPRNCWYGYSSSLPTKKFDSLFTRRIKKKLTYIHIVSV